MNKKILAAAIAAAAVLPMGAQAGVQVYGVIHASIDYVDTESFFDDSDYDDSDGFWDVTSNTSRIGFKGAEDLGNGLKAIWKVEQGVNIAEGGGSWATRNAYIGLAGDWGTFLYGRHDTPLKISTGKLDLFADRTADYNSTIGFIDVRASDAIAYISPNMNGLTIAGAIIPGQDYNSGNDGLADAYSVAAMYSNNGFFISAAYEDIGDLAEPDVDANYWRVGLGYDINAFHIGLVYEDQDFGDAGAELWQVSASYTFGNNVLKGMYGSNDPDADTDISDVLDFGDAAAWAVGLDHNFSKRTTGYLLYTDVDNESYSTIHNYGMPGSAFSMGMIHKF
jgi:predicted porin